MKKAYKNVSIKKSLKRGLFVLSPIGRELERGYSVLNPSKSPFNKGRL